MNLVRRTGNIIKFTLLISLTLSACAPSSPADIETAPAPTMDELPPRTPTTTASQVNLAVDQFDQSVAEWIGFAQDGALSEVAPSPRDGLQWSVDVSPEQIAVLKRDWSALAGADGLTLKLTSLDRPTLLILSVHEADGSAYSVVIPLEHGDLTSYSVAYEEFGLHADSEDENNSLDPEQLNSVNLIDFTAYISSPGSNRVLLEEIVLWEGTPDRTNITCSDPDRGEGPQDFRVGVDASFIPEGEQQGHSFWVGDDRVDPLELLAVNGANAFRLRLFVGEKGEFKLDFASAFFQSMTEFGVDYDYVGLSYYPSAFGPMTAIQFCATLDRLSAEVGKPIIIAETAYPAEPPTGGLFKDWRRSVYGYPLTPEGQAWWLKDFLEAMRGRGDVLGVYLFSPGFWFSGELWGPFALFDSEGRARLAVRSLKTRSITRRDDGNS